MVETGFLYIIQSDPLSVTNHESTDCYRESKSNCYTKAMT